MFSCPCSRNQRFFAYRDRQSPRISASRKRPHTENGLIPRIPGIRAMRTQGVTGRNPSLKNKRRRNAPQGHEILSPYVATTHFPATETRKLVPVHHKGTFPRYKDTDGCPYTVQRHISPPQRQKHGRHLSRYANSFIAPIAGQHPTSGQGIPPNDGEVLSRRPRIPLLVPRQERRRPWTSY